MHQENPTIIDYLRHGQPVGGRRFRGNGVDDPLSDLGWQQMRETTAVLEGWQRIIASPMRRCSEFAHWLGEQRQLEVEIDDALKEVGFGSWEGASRRELRDQRSAEYEAFYRDPVNNRPAGAEPLDRFGDRVAAVFDRLTDTYAGQKLLVVAHAGVIRATLGHVTQSPAGNWYRADVDNAAITRFGHDHLGSRLVAHNWRPNL